MVRILLLEDNYDMSQVLTEVLELHNHYVDHGFSGKEGLDVLTTSPQLPDLIISDLNMPGMNGLEFLRVVRRQPAWAHIPVAIMSGQTADQEEIIEAGADAFVHKPFKYQELEAILKRLV